MSFPRIDLNGAVVAITGAGRGIGRATAAAFAAKGATVCLADLDGGTAADAAAEIRPVGYAYTVDVADRASVDEFIGSVLESLGRIDVLVNNAGVMPLGAFVEEDDAISRTTMDVNVWGLINGMRAVLPHMIERGQGHIVNVASLAGKIAIPGMAVYNASKFAAVGLTASVRGEVEDTGVSVSAVLPSAVRTALASGVPLGHGMPTVDPEDVAKAIVGTVRTRAPETAVPGYAGSIASLQTFVPNPVLRIVRKVVDDKRALNAIDHSVRAEYEERIAKQARDRD